jgi:hypothetical protein
LAERSEIPLWLAAHEAGHVVGRIQLTAAWFLSGLDRPGCMEEVSVWIEADGTPRGCCVWGYTEPLPFPWQAIDTAAGPIAEARVRGIGAQRCLRRSEDYEQLRKWVARGYADLAEAMREGTRIVDECWADIEKLAIYLQKHQEATFAPISKLLDLPNGRCIYDQHTRPDINPVRRPLRAAAAW